MTGKTEVRNEPILTLAHCARSREKCWEKADLGCSRKWKNEPISGQALSNAGIGNWKFETGNSKLGLIPGGGGPWVIRKKSRNEAWMLLKTKEGRNPVCVASLQRVREAEALKARGMGSPAWTCPGPLAPVAGESPDVLI